MIHVTGHAIQRYQERVANVPDDEVRALLSSPKIVAAAMFGARYVRLPGNHRICIRDMAITTILPA